MKLRVLAVVTFGALLLSGSATAQQAGKVHRVGHLQIAPREAQVPSSRDIGIATGSLDALRGIDEALADW